MIVLYSFGTGFDKLGPTEEGVSIPIFVVQVLFVIRYEFFVGTKFFAKLKSYKLSW